MATGFSFGAAKPATGGFNLGAGPTPILGTPQPGSITFGTPVGQANPVPQFGATPNFSGATTAPSFNFNAPAATPSLNFKSPASTGLAFGTGTGTPTLSGGLTLGAPVPATTSGFNFNLGGGTSTTGALNFSSAIPTTPGLTLGTSTAASGSGLFGTLASKPATATAPTLNFGESTFTPSLNFGAPAAGVPTTGLNIGLGSTSAATSALSFGLTASKPATSTPTVPIGLGGIPSTQSKSGVPTSTGQSETQPKDNLLPNEILQTVEHFKTYVKDQKSICSDIARYSSKDFETVHIDIASILSVLMEVENELQKNRQLAEKLKYDTARGLQHAEMAQRTHDTPPGLQYDNNAPLQYFIDLVNGFEKTLQALKIQVDITEKHVRTRGQATALTPQELALGMRRLHETFVALAGCLQSVHTQVESQKKEYLNIRKYLLGDMTNVFEGVTKESVALEVAVKSVLSPPKIAPGPTPFSTFGGPFVPNTAPPAYPGAGAPAIGLQNTQRGTLYGVPQSQQGLFNITESSGFQLQKPPAGNKRGKH